MNRDFDFDLLHGYCTVDAQPTSTEGVQKVSGLPLRGDELHKKVQPQRKPRAQPKKSKAQPKKSRATGRRKAGETMKLRKKLEKKSKKDASTRQARREAQKRKQVASKRKAAPKSVKLEPTRSSGVIVKKERIVWAA